MKVIFCRFSGRSQVNMLLQVLGIQTWWLENKLCRTSANRQRHGKHFTACHGPKCHLLKKKKIKEWLRDGGRVSNVSIISTIWRIVPVHPPFSVRSHTNTHALMHAPPCTPYPFPSLLPRTAADYINHLCRGCRTRYSDLQSEPGEQTRTDICCCEIRPPPVASKSSQSKSWHFFFLLQFYPFLHAGEI